MDNIIYRKYDVITGDWPEMNDSSVQSGRRPGIVIQNDIGNKHSPTLVVLPLSKHLKKPDQPTHMLIPKDKDNGLSCDSMLLAEQIITIGKQNVRKIGRISDKTQQQEIFKRFLAISAYGDGDEDMQCLNVI